MRTYPRQLYQTDRKFLLSYNAHLKHRLSIDSRISPFRKLAMVFGYRNYEISRFVESRIAGSFQYSVFVIQYILFTVIITICLS
jgi:hypothetical protein